MTDNNDFITRAELAGYLDSLGAQATAGFASTLDAQRDGDDRIRATLDDVVRQVNEALARVLQVATAVVGDSASIASTIAYEVAKQSAEDFTARLTDKITLNISMPEQSPTPVTVENNVSVELPPRKIETKVERDGRGLITKTTATEADA